MAEYIGDGEEDICPVMYIWDPVEMGKWRASCPWAVVRDIEEQPGKDILLDNGAAYRISTGYDGGLKSYPGSQSVSIRTILVLETRL